MPYSRANGFWTNKFDEHKTGFFAKLTPCKSQRENWYVVTEYVAEFWCTISNVMFLYYGFYHQCWELVVAGTASILSHSIPKQWLLYLDKIGAWLAVSKPFRMLYMCGDDMDVIDDYVLGLLGGALVLGGLDVYVSRNHYWHWIHVIWHLGTAYISHLFLVHISGEE